jgi:hypothetical protein
MKPQLDCEAVVPGCLPRRPASPLFPELSPENRARQVGVFKPGQDRVYALLALLCFLRLSHELWAAFQSAGNWDQFVHLVRQLVV